jgi:phage FluMu protein gp41
MRAANHAARNTSERNRKMSDDFASDDDYISDDFGSLIAHAQLNELEEVERQRDQEREAALALARKHNPKFGTVEGPTTLMQIAGLQTQKELDVIAAEKNAIEDKKAQQIEKQRKEAEHARLVDPFPPPELD